MPPLATFERDLTAEALIADWINLDLPARQSFAQWQVVPALSTYRPRRIGDGGGHRHHPSFAHRAIHQGRTIISKLEDDIRRFGTLPQDPISIDWEFSPRNGRRVVR